METVQEQRLQLKNEVLRGLKYGNCCFTRGGGRAGGGGKNLVGTFFLVEEDYPRLVHMMEF